MRAELWTGMRWIPVLFLFAQALIAQAPPAVSSGGEARVELALLKYAEGHDPQYLAQARDLALQMLSESGEPQGNATVSPEPLLRVAHAGGNTLKEAARLVSRLEALLDQMGERGTTDANAQLIRALFLYAQAGESEAVLEVAARKAQDFVNRRLVRTASGVHVVPGGSQATEPSLLDYIETVGALIDVASVVPQVGNAKLLNTVARDLVSKFWDEDKGLLAPHKVDSAMMGPLAGPFLNARAVPVLWFAGHATGDPFLWYRAKRIAKAIEKEGMENPLLKADTELALAIVGQPPIALVVVGSSGDPEVLERRKEAFFSFEPLKVVLNLDPNTDGPRLAGLHVKPGHGISVCRLDQPDSTPRGKLEGREAIESACLAVRVHP